VSKDAQNEASEPIKARRPNWQSELKEKEKRE
jgi:hypothetical protein